MSLVQMAYSTHLKFLFARGRFLRFPIFHLVKRGQSLKFCLAMSTHRSSEVTYYVLFLIVSGTSCSVCRRICI